MTADWWVPPCSAIREVDVGILLEVCVDSPQSLAAAIAGGADRVELCSALDVSGLTPTPGLLTLAAKAPIPVYAMIRPRAGDFVFGADDETAMLADIDAVRAAGLAGVVLGASRPDDTLDLALLTRLTDHATGLGVTLHRAFDLVPNADEALEQAVELGVERVLTSGLEVSAPNGLDRLGRLVEQAKGRLSIMPGSGINLMNAEQIVRQTGAREIHSSCRRPIDGVSPKAIAFGFQASASYATDSGIVRSMRAMLDEIG
jgi:copper homeostasis protein